MGWGVRLVTLSRRSPSGVFNPNSEDPLPGQLKKQLVLRIISGQQLPKPRDSMLGDRGEVGGLAGGGRGCYRAAPDTLHPQIIDPFVEVEVIGLPVDCSKDQTRVVDDNGEGGRARQDGVVVLVVVGASVGDQWLGPPGWAGPTVWEEPAGLGGA